MEAPNYHLLPTARTRSIRFHRCWFHTSFYQEVFSVFFLSFPLAFCQYKRPKLEWVSHELITPRNALVYYLTAANNKQQVQLLISRAKRSDGQLYKILLFGPGVIKKKIKNRNQKSPSFVRPKTRFAVTKCDRYSTGTRLRTYLHHSLSLSLSWW